MRGAGANAARPCAKIPRGRGKPGEMRECAGYAGSIPAWAGETCEDISECVGDDGLSPRGRGKPPGRTALRIGIGSIPAWAGETTDDDKQAVYPRVGGGNHFELSFPALSPGLSPRGRGKQFGSAWRDMRRRSIPAWAGETRVWRTSLDSAAVYPRVGGGNQGLAYLFG